MEDWLKEKTSISWVKEFCDRKSIPVPTYDIHELCSGSQPPTFKSTVSITVDGITLSAEGTAPTKQGAKHKTAEVLLEKMTPEMKEILKPKKASHVTSINDEDPVSTIKMMCDQKKFSQPTYIDGNVEGPSHIRVFTVLCTIEQLAISCSGSGKTKKDAKKAAATNVVQQLQEKGYLEKPSHVVTSTKSADDILDDFSNLSLAPQEQIVPDEDTDMPELENSDDGSRVDYVEHFESKYRKEFEELDCLGAGGFGKVFKAKKLFDARIYAIKRIVTPTGEKPRKKVLKEVQALAKLDHPNIVRYFDAWIEEPPAGYIEEQERNESETGTTSLLESVGTTKSALKPESRVYLYIQQELCQFGSMKTLEDWFVSNEQRDVKMATHHFLEIAKAMECIHSNNIIHRDLKPSNIFIKENIQGDPGTFMIKVGDFGLATNALDQENLLGTALMSGNGTYNSSTGGAGTKTYMSPEQRNKLQKPQDYSTKVDIYPMGMIFFELIVPFSTQNERAVTLGEMREQKFPSDFVTRYRSEHKLIKQMMATKANDRPDASYVKSWAGQRLSTLNNEKNN